LSKAPEVTRIPLGGGTPLWDLGRPPSNARRQETQFNVHPEGWHTHQYNVYQTPPPPVSGRAGDQTETRRLKGHYMISELSCQPSNTPDASSTIETTVLTHTEIDQQFTNIPHLKGRCRVVLGGWGKDEM